MSGVLDGLLEGHEGKGSKLLVRAGMFSYIVLTLFSTVASIAVVKKPDFRVFTVLVALGTLGIAAVSLQYVTWYKRDNMDPKFKKSIYGVIFLTLLLDIGLCMNFHDVVTYQPAPPPPTVTPAPSTPAPTFAPGPSTPTPITTPSPNGTPNGTHNWLQRKRDRPLRQQRHQGQQEEARRPRVW